MKIEVRKLGQENGQVLAVNAKRIAIQPPPDSSPYMLTAELEEGDSPIKILLDNGTEQAVKRLTLTRRDSYFVKAFRRGATRPCTVSAHHRKMPATLQHYARTMSPEHRAKLSESASKAWTPERRRRQRATIKEKQAQQQQAEQAAS